MADLEGFPPTSVQLKDASEQTDRALSLLQWTDLTPTAVAETAPVYIQSFFADCLEALEQLQMASLRIEEEARTLRTSFDRVKVALAERKSQKIGLAGSALCVYKSLVISRLYSKVEAPVAYLTLASPLPRILMKRRAFT